MYVLKGQKLLFHPKNVVFLSESNFVFKLANSADPDEMPRFAAFHLGLHCLQKYPFKGFKSTRG